MRNGGGGGRDVQHLHGRSAARRRGGASGHPATVLQLACGSADVLEALGVLSKCFMVMDRALREAGIVFISRRHSSRLRHVVRLARTRYSHGVNTWDHSPIQREHDAGFGIRGRRRVQLIAVALRSLGTVARSRSRRPGMDRSLARADAGDRYTHRPQGATSRIGRGRDGGRTSDGRPPADNSGAYAPSRGDAPRPTAAVLLNAARRVRLDDECRSRRLARAGARSAEVQGQARALESAHCLRNLGI